MSYNQPPPGPYGQQPQQPGPYGQQPQGPYGQPPQGGAPGQPGYGYPQQQQPGPYGQPQQGGYPGQPPGPYAQDPQGGYPGQQPGGYPGQPHDPYGQGGYPPPPPSGGGKGKAIGITIGALAVVGAIIGGFFLFSGGDDDSSGKGNSAVEDDGAHKLEMPQSFGDYKKQNGGAGANTGASESTVKSRLEGAGVKNGEPVVTTYSNVDISDPGSDPGAAASMKFLQFSGAWGEVDNPSSTLDKMFQAEEDPTEQGVELEGSPKAVSPGGLDGAVMKCQSAKVTQGGAGGQTAVMCGWADKSTVGMVVMAQAMGSVSQDDAAKETAELRSAARVKS